MLRPLLMPIQLMVQSGEQALPQVFILQTKMRQALQGREFLQPLLQHIDLGKPVTQFMLHNLIATQLQFIETLQSFFQLSTRVG